MVENLSKTDAFGRKVFDESEHERTVLMCFHIGIFAWGKTGQRQESFRLHLAHRFFMKKVRSKRNLSFWRNIKSVLHKNGKTAK